VQRGEDAKAEEEAERQRKEAEASKRKADTAITPLKSQEKRTKENQEYEQDMNKFYERFEKDAIKEKGQLNLDGIREFLKQKVDERVRLMKSVETMKQYDDTVGIKNATEKEHRALLILVKKYDDLLKSLEKADADADADKKKPAEAKESEKKEEEEEDLFDEPSLKVRESDYEALFKLYVDKHPTSLMAFLNSDDKIAKFARFCVEMKAEVKFTKSTEKTPDRLIFKKPNKSNKVVQWPMRTIEDNFKRWLKSLNA